MPPSPDAATAFSWRGAALIIRVSSKDFDGVLFQLGKDLTFPAAFLMIRRTETAMTAAAASIHETGVNHFSPEY